MENQTTISNAPMILGIIGGVLGLPAAICSGACAAGLSTLAQANKATQSAQSMESAESLVQAFLWFGLVAVILGLTSAFLYKKNPKRWGAVMLLAGILSGVTLITFNFLSLITCLLFLIGGAIAVAQNKPAVAV